MAKLKSIFEFGGRIGNFVVYPLNGKLCMRSLPETPPPMCAEMVAQQGRMKAVAILYRAMKAAGLLEAWQRLEKPAGWSAYNLFTKQNIRVLTEEGFIGDFQHLAVTAGKVAQPVGCAIKDERLTINDGGCASNDEGLTINEEGLRINEMTGVSNDERVRINDKGLTINEGLLEVVWEAGTGYAHCRGDDRLGAVLMKGEGKWFGMKVLEVVEGGTRSEGRAVLRVPEELRGWRYLYCFMRSRTGDFSPSVCVDLKDAGVR